MRHRRSRPVRMLWPFWCSRNSRAYSSSSTGCPRNMETHTSVLPIPLSVLALPLLLLLLPPPLVPGVLLLGWCCWDKIRDR